MRPAPPMVLHRPVLLLGLSLLAAGVGTAGAARAEDLPYPAGESVQQLEERKVVLVRPQTLLVDRPASLVIVLHGAGGTASGMARSFAPWAEDGYVVCAPKSRDLTWEPDDLKRVLRIAAHLKTALPIDADRVHVVGFSNGGWNLCPLAFDEELKPRSATWIASGYPGGPVPRWARERMGVIALAGSEDPNNRAARATVPALRDKVRTAEFREQAGLDHSFPRELMPYLQWWMGIQEGRIVAGQDLALSWTEDLDAAIASQEGRKKGGVLVWFFAATDAETPEGRSVQRDLFFDPEVRFLAGQIPCVRLDAAAHAAPMTAFKVKGTPALVVLDRKGKAKKVYEGEISARKLARTLRSIAPQRRMPED